MNRKYRVNGINMSCMHQMCDCNSLDLSDLFLKCLSFRSENNFFLHGIGLNSVFNSIPLQKVAENHNVSYVFLDTCTWLPEKFHTTNMVTCKKMSKPVRFPAKFEIFLNDILNFLEFIENL